MVEVPETKYARTADGLYIAYQVGGAGPPDLIFAPGSVSHLETYWEYDPVVRWNQRMASFARYIAFDKRGTGLSDPVPSGRPPTLEERMDDLRAVIDTLEIERVALLGFVEGNAMATLFAATYPERVSALILYGPWMRFTWAPDYPWAPPREFTEVLVASIEVGTDLDVLLPLLAPTVAQDLAFRTWFAKLQRHGGSPGQRQAFHRMNTDIDVRSVMPSIRVPTLVLHRRQDVLVPVEAGRWAASQIPGAKLVVTEGCDHLPFIGNFEDIAGEIEEFLTGNRHPTVTDRVLATVLFVDIVGSTDQAVQLGDARWSQLVDAYEQVVARQLGHFRGRLVKTLGDGSLATFDGPGRAVRCAGAIRDALHALGLHVRAGLHTGEIEIRGDDVAGIAVHIAQRVAALAGPDEVLVSRTVVDLVAGAGIEFDDRGEHQLKGVPAQWRVFASKV